MREKIKELGLWSGGLGGFAIIGILIASLVALLPVGGAWLAEKIMPWLAGISGWTLVITIFVLIPLSFFRIVRGYSAIGLIVSSYVFGITLWVFGFLLTYNLTGWWGILFGLVFFGVGFVPIAMLASLFKSMWFEFGFLASLTLLTFGLRVYGFYVVEKADQDRHGGLRSK